MLSFLQLRNNERNVVIISLRYEYDKSECFSNYFCWYFIVNDIIIICMHLLITIVYESCKYNDCQIILGLNLVNWYR